MVWSTPCLCVGKEVQRWVHICSGFKNDDPFSTLSHIWPLETFSFLFVSLWLLVQLWVIFMYGNKDIFKCWRTKELRDWKGRKGKMSSSKPRCLELYQIELSLGLNSWLQSIEKVIHIYNERLGLYRQCLLKSVGGFPLSTLSLASA